MDAPGATISVGGLYEDEGEKRFSLFITTPTADGKQLNLTGPGLSNVYYGAP